MQTAPRTAMTEPPQEKPPESAPPSGPGMMFGLLVFGFGLAAGLLIAVAGTGVLEDSAGLILTVFLAALFVVALVGGASFFSGGQSCAA